MIRSRQFHGWVSKKQRGKVRIALSPKPWLYRVGRRGCGSVCCVLLEDGKSLMTIFFFLMFYFLASPHGMWNLSSPTGYPVSPALEAQSLNHQTTKEVPWLQLLMWAGRKGVSRAGVWSARKGMLDGQVSQGEIRGQGGRGVRWEGKGRVCSVLTEWKGSFPEAVNVCSLWEQWEGLLIWKHLFSLREEAMVENRRECGQGSWHARAPGGQWRLDTRRPWVILPQWCSAAQRVVRGEDGWIDPRLEFGQTSSVESWWDKEKRGCWWDGIQAEMGMKWRRWGCRERNCKFQVVEQV